VCACVYLFIYLFYFFNLFSFTLLIFLFSILFGVCFGRTSVREYNLRKQFLRLRELELALLGDHEELARRETADHRHFRNFSAPNSDTAQVTRPAEGEAW
jgi:hypothetical protein